MNAYELSDYVADNGYIGTGTTHEVSIMLRQQADRIAELEKEVKRLVGAEPITHGKLTFCKNCGQQDPYAQTKPLSDEEIDEVSKAIWERPWLEKHREFARAIEERHGIK